MRRRLQIQSLAAFLAAASLLLLCPLGAQLYAEPLPVHPPFHISTTDSANETITSGQGSIVSSGGVAVVPISLLETAHGAVAVIPGGKEIAIRKVDAVDEMAGLARVRLGREAPKPSGKLPITPAPSEGQRVTIVTVDRNGLTVRSQCSVKSIREIPYLPGYYLLETSLALPPTGGGIYGEGGALLATVIRRYKGGNTGIVISTELVSSVARMRSSKESLSGWSSGRTMTWSQGAVARYIEARVEVWAGRHVRSVELLEPVIGSAGQLEGAVAALLGESYLTMGLLPESIVAFRSAIENGMVTCRIYQQLAWAYLETGQYDEARKFSEKVIGEQGESAVGFLLLARLNNLQGDYDKAVYEARRALKRFPDCQCAHYERGMAYLGQGRFEAAIESLLQAVKLDPTDADALHGLGYAYLRSGRPQEAVELLKTAGELKPELIEAWRALGEACSRTNRNDEALEAYRQAICADPKNQNSYYKLAAEYLRQGFHDDAITILGQGLDSCGASAWLTYHLGKAYCSVGRLAEARQQAERLSSMNPALAKLLAGQIDIVNGS